MKLPRLVAARILPHLTANVGAVLLSAGFLLLVSWFHAADVWNSHFLEKGPLYLVYNVLRVGFLLCAAWFFFAVGAFILRMIGGEAGTSQRWPGGSILVASFVGAAATSIVMFLLGFLQLYYLPTALLITVPVLFFSFPPVARRLREAMGRARGVWREQEPAQRVASASLMAIFLLLAGYFLGVAGLHPDVNRNDVVGHYLPYYQEVIRRHGLWPNQYYLHYFYSKGAGLFYWAILLTDAQSPQLISYYLVILSSLALAQWIRTVSPRDLTWPMLGATLCLSSSIVLNEFAKQHLAIGSFLVCLVYLVARSSSIAPGDVRLWNGAQGIILFAVGLMSPVGLAIALPFYLLIGGWGIVAKRLIVARSAGMLGVLCCGVAMAVLAFNYVTSGLFEISPMTLTRYRNEALLSRWVSPLALATQIAYNEGTSHFRSVGDVLAWSVLGTFLFKLLLLAVGGTLVVALLRRRRLGYDFLAPSVPALLMLGVVVALLGFVEQASARRFVAFSVFLNVGLYILALKVAVDALAPGRWKTYVAVVVVAVAALVGLRNGWRSVVRPDRLPMQRLAFLVGKVSYAEAYARWFYPPCADVQQILGRGTRVLLLNFVPGCYGIPGSGFQRPLMNVYNRDFGAVVFGDPSAAKRILLEQGIKHVMVDLGRDVIMPGYSPLFSPENMARYLRVVWRKGETYLLTWKDGEERGMEDGFLERYRRRVEEGRGGQWGRAHERVARLGMGVVGN